MLNNSSFPLHRIINCAAEPNKQLVRTLPVGLTLPLSYSESFINHHIGRFTIPAMPSLLVSLMDNNSCSTARSVNGYSYAEDNARMPMCW